MNRRGIGKVTIAVIALVISVAAVGVLVGGGYIMDDGNGEGSQDFEFSNLSISSSEVSRGGEIEVSIDVSNPGESEKTQEIELKVDGSTEGTKEITLAPQGQTTETFSLSREESGTYTVEIGELSEDFEVLETIKAQDLSSIQLDFGESKDNIAGTLKMTNIGDNQNMKMRQELLVEQEIGEIVLNLSLESLWLHYEEDPDIENVEAGWVIATDQQYEFFKEQLLQMHNSLLKNIPENWTGEGFTLQGTQIFNIEINPNFEEGVFEIEDYQEYPEQR